LGFPREWVKLVPMKTLIVVLMALGLGLPLGALGQSEAHRDTLPAPQEGEESLESTGSERIIEGLVRLVGNEPHTRLLLEGPLSVHEFPRESRPEFLPLQGQWVRVRDQGGMDLENPQIRPAPGIYDLLVEPELLETLPGPQ